jgi:hypothetical protein
MVREQRALGQLGPGLQRRVDDPVERRARRKSVCASRTGLPVACATARPNTSPAAQAGSLSRVRARSRFATHSGLPAAVIGVVMIGGSRLTIVVMEQRGVGSHRENGASPTCSPLLGGVGFVQVLSCGIARPRRGTRSRRRAGVCGCGLHG